MPRIDLVGRYTVEHPSPGRRLGMDAYDALPPSHVFMALVDVDVTAALDAIRKRHAEGHRVTLFAFLVQAIAATLAEHPSLNTVRARRRIYRFEDVDVSVPVEVGLPGEVAPLMLVVRRAQDKSAEAIYAEIEAARARHASEGALGAEDRASRPS